MITQDFINGYISSLNNMLYVQRSELVSLRKQYYKGTPTPEVLFHIDNYDYRLVRKIIFKNIHTIRSTKNSYKKLVKDINKLQAQQK